MFYQYNKNSNITKSLKERREVVFCKIGTDNYTLRCYSLLPVILHLKWTIIMLICSWILTMIECVEDKVVLCYHKSYNKLKNHQNVQCYSAEIFLIDYRFWVLTDEWVGERRSNYDMNKYLDHNYIYYFWHT